MVPIYDEIMKIAESILDAGGYELVDITVSSGKRPVIRIYIDRPGGVTVGNCAEVSRSVGFELDAADILNRRYALEVSSPGLNRPLKTERDFARNIGKEVWMMLRDDDDRNVEIRGSIKVCNNENIAIEINGEEKIFKLSEIMQCKLVY